MVRIIEREVVKNKDLFDKILSLSLGQSDKIHESKVIMHFAIISLGLQTIPSLLLLQIEEYCRKYPYTILKG